MARVTMQGRIRTFGGRTPSAIDKRDGTTHPLLAQNLAGPIQIVLPEDPPDGAHEVGFLPAYWAMQSIRPITAATAGTIEVTLPAYNGMAGVTVVAATGDATDTALLTMVPDLFTSYPKDRPLVVTTTGVTGMLRLGIFGFPLDDGTEQGG